MTDSSPGPGWWLASDGNWYPPQAHPDARPHRAGADDALPHDDDTIEVPVLRSGPPAASDSDADDTLLSVYGIAADAPAGDHGALSAQAEATIARSSIDWDEVAREREARQQARERDEHANRRRAVAVAGVVLVLAAIGVVALALRGDGDDQADRTATTGPTGPPTTMSVPVTTAPATTGPTGAATGATGTLVSVFALEPGACIDQDDLTTGLITAVRSVPCDEPHSHEVYFTTSVTPADGDYDAAFVTSFANEACAEGFTDYVGVPYERSRYYYVHLAPSEESWNKSNDRDVVCLLLLEGEQLTSSAKGSNQ